MAIQSKLKHILLYKINSAMSIQDYI